MTLSRRDTLNRIAVGFGGLAANSLLASNAFRLPARAKRIVFLFMHGGPSHIDLFDHKPKLEKYHGRPLPFSERKVTFAKRGNVLAPPWKLRQVGQSGLWMSKLWQYLPTVADELCMLHSVCETNVAHGGACMKMHTGEEALLRPSMGAWVSYGIGTENQNLPAFVTICPTSLHGGENNYGAAFLPSRHQGVPLGTPGYPNSTAKNAKFHYMENKLHDRADQEQQLGLLRRMHERSQAQGLTHPDLEARLQSFELAFRMQMAAPDAMNIRNEPESIRKLYGMDDPKTENFGHQCLLARRMAERDVRFIQVSHAGSLPFNNEQWDQHSHLEQGHSINVGQIDKPITGLIMDLKSRGLLDDTLVLWGGEFGRTPTTQAGTNPAGRDHHPDGFTMWMAGGGVKRGFRYGKTDEFGYHAIEDRCTIHDLHATILHLLGIDHERLTYRHNGRDFRLTDVYGDPAREILA
ncbi:MAG: sulfatase [Verrucomicrobiales bacterium]|nr:sulfatase [Verrucomicrobiales bacterium]|tara:strand:- start:917 stop:2308 length:1392 start_codon:yes stop_codon:yes gene_type:complete